MNKKILIFYFIINFSYCFKQLFRNKEYIECAFNIVISSKLFFGCNYFNVKLKSLNTQLS